MKRAELIFSVVVMAALTVTGLVIALKTPRTYSENENRYLQTDATPTWETILDGQWQEDITAYMSDQMPLRDTWTGLQTRLQKWFGRKEIAGVYLGKEDYYFEICTEADITRGRLISNVQAIGALAAAMPQSQVYVIPAPTAAAVYTEYLPKHAPYYAEDDKIQLASSIWHNSGCIVVDVRQELTERADQGEQLYYRTDHHWNTRGAFAAYEMFGKAVGLQTLPEEQWDLQIISEAFRGTLDSKVLDADGAADIVEVPFALPKVSVTADGTSIGVLDMTKLYEKDQYQVFFGGNYGQVTIETGADTGKTLLIFKDSYANCFVPFLLTHYDTITMIDLRYNDGSWTDLLAASPDDVLVLYEMSNFCKDMNVSTIPLLLETT